MSEMKKPFTHINEQIEILKSRDLSIADDEDSCDKLLRHNYYTVVDIKHPHTLAHQDTFSRVEGFYLSVYNRCEFLLAPCYTCRGICQP